MKYNNREISDFNDNELLQTYTYFIETENKRIETSKHKKFDRSKDGMVFPSPNPEFLKLKEALEIEIKSRNLKPWIL